jgi:hypothetical protein
MLGLIMSCGALLASHHLQQSVPAGENSLDLLRSCNNFVSLIGLPFCSHTADGLLKPLVALVLGVFGIFGLLFGATINWRQKQVSLACIYALLVAFSGLISAAAVSVFRSSLSAWYCVFTIPLWICIAQLMVTFLVRSKNSENTRWQLFVETFFSIAILSAILILTVSSNRSYLDKDPYQYSHSLSAESSIRNYFRAPTYSELLLFRFHNSDVRRMWDMGQFVSERKLSCSANRQIWTMQGDFILENVNLMGVDSGRPFWVKANGKEGEVLSPEHLSLAMPLKSLSIWKLDLPKTIQEANLVLESTDLLRGLHLAIVDPSSRRLLSHKTIDGVYRKKVSLKPFAGHSVILVVKTGESKHTSVGKILKLLCPRIEVELLPSAESARLSPIRPVNTELGFNPRNFELEELIVSSGVKDLSSVWNVRFPGKNTRRFWFDFSAKRCGYVSRETVKLASFQILSTFSLKLAKNGESLPKQVCVEFITRNMF